MWFYIAFSPIDPFLNFDQFFFSISLTGYGYSIDQNQHCFKIRNNKEEQKCILETAVKKVQKANTSTICLYSRSFIWYFWAEIA